jgi:3-hydroxymyristoyl/3-hydroxydecanoyl-(acyl carrier protein) dehydratase
MPGNRRFAALDVDGTTARGVVRPEHARALCEGHFPGDPIVPGAHLAGLMAEVAATLARGRLAALERCVFVRRVAPDAPIVVTARRADPARVEADVRTGDTVAARATLRFAR